MRPRTYNESADMTDAIWLIIGHSWVNSTQYGISDFFTDIYFH